MKKVVVLIIVLCGLLIAIDIECILFTKKPIINYITNRDEEKLVYKGLIYDTYMCYKYDKPQIKAKWSKFECPKKEEGKVINIVDVSKTIKKFSCIQFKEQIFEVEDITYCLPCIKSDYIVVEYENGYKESISDAIVTLPFTISDLEKYNIEYEEC